MPWCTTARTATSGMQRTMSLRDLPSVQARTRVGVLRRAHRATGFPFGQVSAAKGATVEIVDRQTSGWFEIRLISGGGAGMVPGNIVFELPMEPHGRLLLAAASSATAPAPSSPAQPGQRAEPAAAAAEITPASVSVRFHTAGGAGPGETDAMVAPDDAVAPAAASPRSACMGACRVCISKCKRRVDIELGDRVKYSMWSKFVTAGAGIILVIQGVMMMLMGYGENQALADDKYAHYRTDTGEITTKDTVYGAVTVAFGTGLYMFERYKARPAQPYAANTDCDPTEPP